MVWLFLPMNIAMFVGLVILLRATLINYFKDVKFELERENRWFFVGVILIITAVMEVIQVVITIERAVIHPYSIANLILFSLYALYLLTSFWNKDKKRKNNPIFDKKEWLFTVFITVTTLTGWVILF